MYYKVWVSNFILCCPTPEIFMELILDHIRVGGIWIFIFGLHQIFLQAFSCTE